jgi:uncharacterized membrane protein YeaQ/YmgE (transglycosylase-associated protein family)
MTVTPAELLIMLLVAAVIGAVGQAVAGYTAGGCLVSIVLGFIGAFLGNWASRQLDLPDIFVVHFRDIDFPVLWSIIGAALFVALLSLISGRRV